jgi:hypothetical protein
MNSIFFTSRRRLLGLAAAAALPAFATARAEEKSAAWPVILTIGGLIDAPNRKPFNATRDRFFNHNNLDFQKARAFTAGELAAFPQQSARADLFGTEALVRGPRLSDVLAAAIPSAGAKTARLSALDGYAAEIALADVQSQQWILAMESDGQPFGIGDLGPLFALRQLPPGEKKTEEEANKWVYALYYIEIVP